MCRKLYGRNPATSNRFENNSGRDSIAPQLFLIAYCAFVRPRCFARSAASCALLGPVWRYINATPQIITNASPINCAVAMPLISHASGR